MTRRQLATLGLIIVAVWGSACSQTNPQSVAPAASPAPPPPATAAPMAMPIMPQFAPDELTAAAAKVGFKTESSVPASGSDVIDYFDVKTDPALRSDVAVILGKMRVKKDHVRIKGTTTNLPPGDYIDWLGKKNGVWVRGYSTPDGKVMVATEAHFGELPEKNHKSTIHAFFTDPSQLDARVAEAKALQGPVHPVPTIPPRPTTPPRPTNPPRETPTPRPSTPTPTPHPWPHCVQKCKTLIDFDKHPPMYYWVVDWVEVD
jgi:hypothetical protein